jgi:hypothetical protein
LFTHTLVFDEDSIFPAKACEQEVHKTILRGWFTLFKENMLKTL